MIKVAARHHPAWGSRILAGAISFFATMVLAARFALVPPVQTAVPSPARAQTAVAAAPPRVIVRIVHVHRGGATSTTTTTRAAPRTRIVRRIVTVPATTTTTTHAS